jgi:hypothetical protein
MQNPTSPHYYYFTGSFTSNVRSKAYNSAKAECIGTILFMINSTISASQTFEKVYTRRTGQRDNSEARLFKKIKTSGRAVVSRLQFVQTHFERSGSNWTSYVLARIPKMEVDKAIKEFAEMRKRLASLKSACVILVKYPDGSVNEATELKSFIEKFYRESLGYNIVESNLDLNALANLNMGQLTFKLKELLSGYDQAIIGLVSLVDRPVTSRNRIGGIRTTTTSVSGSFLLRTVELKTMKVMENNSYSARGVAMVNNSGSAAIRRSAREAMDELIKEFKKQLQGDDSGASGRDAIFD